MSFNSNDKQKIFRAGIIPYIINNDGEIEMLFMKPAHTLFGADIDPVTGDLIMKYQLAKGRIEKGEDALTAAIREGCEETGLVKENIMATWYIGTFLGRTEVFVAKCLDKENFTETDIETESVKWLTIDQFEKEGRELHMELVETAHMIIEMNEEYL
ncbi:MAG: NUDIX domain-containing protein [Candidatus Riesia sp.]|nr:NUDIX domain-containing protein [Candidatus Riesia sp.]